MKKIIGVMAVAMLLIGALIAPASAVDSGNADTCATFDGGSYTKHDGDTSGEWGSVKFEEDKGPLELNVNLGYEVDLCLKKGSDQSGHGGAIHAPENPFGAGQHFVEFPEAEGEGFSHYGLKFRVVPIVCSDLVEDADFPDRVVEEGEDPQDVCFEEDDEDPLTLTLVKAWDVDDEDDLWDEADASYTLTIDGEEFTGAVEVEDGDEVLIGETDVVVSESCEFLGSDAGPITIDAEDADEDGLITVTVTNTVECSAVLPGEPQEQEPEGEEEPVVESVQVEKKTEVLGTTATLPATGVPALVLALLGLLAIGSGGAILRRR